jgi:hypothetical protein
MELGQRRSLRIRFSIPVVLRGVDEDGRPFEAAGRTITLNQHGARLQAGHRLRPGQTISVTNPASGAEAEFRVIGPLAPPLDEVGEWGIECLHADQKIWKIDFPPLAEGSDAHILLECRHCRAMTLQSLSLVEVEVLETAGLLTKPCAHCGKSTPWGYPPQVFQARTQADPAAAGDVTGGDSLLTKNRRKMYRKQAQLPVRVRDYFGEIEMAQTENISPDGFCFSSLHEYQVGQGIVVICPFDAALEKAEALARIVRIGPESHPERYIYGVRYDQVLR